MPYLSNVSEKQNLTMIIGTICSYRSTDLKLIHASYNFSDFKYMNWILKDFLSMYNFLYCNQIH